MTLTSSRAKAVATATALRNDFLTSHGLSYFPVIEDDLEFYINQHAGALNADQVSELRTLCAHVKDAPKLPLAFVYDAALNGFLWWSDTSDHMLRDGRQVLFVPQAAQHVASYAPFDFATDGLGTPAWRLVNYPGMRGEETKRLTEQHAEAIAKALIVAGRCPEAVVMVAEAEDDETKSHSDAPPYLIIVGEDMRITDPFASTCARFEIDPKEYGLDRFSAGVIRGHNRIAYV